MVAQRLGRPVRIAGLDGLDDPVVLVDGDLVPPGRGQRGDGHQRHGAVNEIELADEKAVVGGEVDLLVEAPVGPRQRGRVADQLAVVLHHVAQDADLLVGGVDCGEAGGEALELGAHGVEFRELVVIERRDDQAAAAAGEQGLGLQPLQRLPHRGPRHAEPLGEVALHQLVAGAELAHVDGVENERVRVPAWRLHGSIRFCRASGNARLSPESMAIAEAPPCQRGCGRARRLIRGRRLW